MELLEADGSVPQAAWGNVVPFCGRLDDVEMPGQVPKRARLGEAAVQPPGAHGGDECNSEDVTFSDSEDSKD